MTVLYPTKVAVLDAMIEWYTAHPMFGWNEQDGACQYRVEMDSRSVERCAMGCLIPDSLYHEDWDRGGGYAASDVLATYPDVAALFGGFTTDLGHWLDVLQREHDGRAAGNDADPNPSIKAWIAYLRERRENVGEE